MKKIRILPVLLFISLFGYAQKPVSLTFETHALKNETTNDMLLCKYSSPGKGGEHVVWDFSALQRENDFQGIITSAYMSNNSAMFPSANTELIEFGNSFYFKIENNQVEQVGYASKSNYMTIDFEKPFLKMKYPFTMGDKYNGDYFGTFTTKSGIGKIDGTYEVEADGYGKLILPNGYVADNTLRIKTTRNYTQISPNNKSQDIVITTYRWYTENYRYPLLVLIESKYINGSSETYAHQAAYNNTVKTTKISNDLKPDEPLLTVHPVPARTILNIDFSVTDEARVTIYLYDMQGKIVKSLVDAKYSQGSYHYELDVVKEDIFHGTYFIKAIIGNKTETKEVIIW